MAVAKKISLVASNDSAKSSSSLLNNLISRELIFAVVGPAGSGTSWIASALSEILRKSIPDSEVVVLKASQAISSWAESTGFPIDNSSRLARAKSLQDGGDKIRSKDTAGVAVSLISEIIKKRDSGSDAKEAPFRVYILDSLKNPAEVSLLRSVYQEAFCLIGVVCESQKRRSRLRDGKCNSSSGEDIDKFIERDQDSGLNSGQKVSDTFHLADFFIDNTEDRFSDQANRAENPEWDVNDQLGRLIDILTFKKIVRPTASETGMFHAYGAKMTSACLSRQVGAALMDGAGNLLSTGKNEVPAAGGGVYGGGFQSDSQSDHRCAYSNEYCSSNKHQDLIIKELMDSIPELQGAEPLKIKAILKKTGIGRLLEFSRAVHAEMDALFTAARQGISPVGSRLFVTTFPCHYCARHIVSAGVDEVQYIEPYPKSLAFDLHGDAIESSKALWVSPSDAVIAGNKLIVKLGEQSSPKVLFRAFTGVAPRLYRQAFMKDRKLKDEQGEMTFGKPEWSSGLLVENYQAIEKRLVENMMEE
ncbi:anti-phage dCTP deaminase [Pseudomonas sp. zfem005]|uniref:anti-phage dCTP deaminase n=1 Tax=Pseudomonas sp. zfem005 TaxID=3078200 RepID=UPI002929D046|nr:anti-phage dCTP deaminase [Pseudomonas sp. zfem005]MDU9413201.1 anti-phage dCTP deaminase [Pseudomonas sp. zfem005]